MSDNTVYQYARISATIGAGIFTGLTLSAPVYTLPAASAFSPFQSAQQKQYATEKQKLSASDRLTLFKTVHHATGAVTIPVAVISGSLYALAAYFSPVHVAYNARFVGRGAGEIGSRYISDSLLTRLTAPRALLIGSSIALFSIIPISSLISDAAARKALALEPRLIADAAIASTGVNTGVATESEKQLDKQLAAWSFGTQLATVVGLIASVAGAWQLTGHSLTD
ncbi:hypothetical protein DL93DRAFT_2078663 [Clavulina sp. PMI_390]|nr:hypothetical protein DL93DRAFT_2078663 [Clavulina sp. PMI_390]